MRLSIYIRLMSPLLLISFLSCEKFVSIDPPKTQAQSHLIFASDGTAISAASGLYVSLVGPDLYLMNGAMFAYPGLSADELLSGVATSELLAYQSNQLIADNSINNATRIWRTAYASIYHANSVLEGLEKSTAITDSVRRQLRGEMLTMRSLFYFYLVNIYGDVPLELTTDYLQNSVMPRTAVNLIYQQLVTDLEEAKTLLKPSYPSASRGRPNRWTAGALLARIYLYTSNWSKAEAESEAVINAGMYSLNPSLSGIFTSTSSPETIFQLIRDKNNTSIGLQFTPLSATVRPGFYLTTSLLSAFETGDNRKTNWINKSTSAGVDYYYAYKYRQRSITSGTPSEYLIVLRLAEQYLIRAEARVKQGNLSGALSDLNKIRTRAGLAGLNLTDAAAINTAIQKERQIEYFAEWGDRWFNLKRTGTVNAVIGALKPATWQPTDALYPIPLAQMERNPFLVQNPGY